MIGLGWRNKDFGWAVTIDPDGTVVRIPRGQGGNTSHGKRIDAVLTRLGDHPIHRNLPRQWKVADLEVYSYARGPAENMTVLSYTREPETGLNFPIEWVVQYGKGRVYNSTFGHVWKDDINPPATRCVAFQTLLIRAVEWLSGEEVTSPTPVDFPDQENIRLH
jgi:type 1 glutamine amidotransferase